MREKKLLFVDMSEAKDKLLATDRQIAEAKEELQSLKDKLACRQAPLRCAALP
jgi:hypothetical protein